MEIFGISLAGQYGLVKKVRIEGKNEYIYIIEEQNKVAQKVTDSSLEDFKATLEFLEEKKKELAAFKEHQGYMLLSSRINELEGMFKLIISIHEEIFKIFLSRKGE